MNKQRVKVIRKVAEEHRASKSPGYKKVQLGTKKPVTLQVVALGRKLLKTTPIYDAIVSESLFKNQLYIRKLQV